MLSATAVHEIRAPVAQVWNVLVDAGVYECWHPFLSGISHPRRELWSGDSLTAGLRRAETAPDDLPAGALRPTGALLPTRALVVEIRRHRLLSMLLQQQNSERTAVAPRHPDDLPKHVGAYRVDLEAGRAGHTVLSQRISLRYPHRLVQTDLDSLLGRVAAGVTWRTELTRGDVETGRPIRGSVCVSSRSGLRRCQLASHPRFLTTIAEWMARCPGRDAQ